MGASISAAKYVGGDLFLDNLCMNSSTTQNTYHSDDILHSPGNQKRGISNFF